MKSDIDLNYLDRTLERLDLKVEGVEEEVKKIYKKYKRRTYHGHKFSNKFLVCASIYIVCKKKRMPRGMDEVVEAGGFNVHSSKPITKDERKFGRVWKKVARELNEPIEPFIPSDWVPRIVSLLNKEGYKAGEDVEFLAHKLCEDFEGEFKGSLKVYATAMVYISYILNGFYITQEDMADITYTTETTLRDAYKQIVEELNIRNRFQKEMEKKGGEDEGSEILKKHK